MKTVTTSPSYPHTPWRCPPAALCLALLMTASSLAQPAPEGPAAAQTFGDYLTTWKIDRTSRAVLEEPSDWNAAKQDVALRVLARLARVPANLASQWQADAAAAGSLAPAQRVQDQWVRVDGRAIMVAEVPLSAEQAELAGRPQLDLVRIVADGGLIVDVLADRVPRAWPRGKAIDEPAAAVGLPLSEGAGPDAVGPRAALLIAAAHVAWFPPTPLGSLGMDYGLFDSVVDGQKLVAGDTEAFYAMLAAVSRATQAGLDSAAGPPGDIVPLIDPSQGWFEKHRGDPFTLQGVARRATRIEIDDPVRRLRLGTDHYWELFVFVPTPLIKINDRLQEDFPVVCCVLTLPTEMPTGAEIGERVRVSGFALKRYGYPLPDVRISSSQGDQVQKGERQETALLIGRQATWLPAPNPTREVNTLGWVFLSIAALVGLALAVAAWSYARDSRRRDRQARSSMPDRIELP